MKHSYLSWFFAIVIVLLFNINTKGEQFKHITIVTSKTPTKVEQNILGLLQDRIKERSSVTIEVQNSFIPSNASQSLTLYIGIGTANESLSVELKKVKQTPINSNNLGEEGFLLVHTEAKTPTVLLAAVDQRGLLYGVGELLRQIHFHASSISVPAIQIRKAPAFEVRGTQYGQSHVLLTKAKARQWTKVEKERAILELALAGANTFLVEKSGNSEMEDYHFLKSYDLKTCGVANTNISENRDYPASWKAKESIGRLNFLCPSEPEAHDHLLEIHEKRFQTSPPYDYIQLKGGDGGGCECDRCKPYGKTFIHLAEKIGKIIHKYHPNSKIYFTNQKFDNESDSAILEYLNEKPRTWLWAWGYGPGSDATTWQPGHRQNHRMDLFRYPGFGPYGLYPKELLHQLPPQQKIVYFNEITHWKYAQHAYIQMYPRADKNGDLPPTWSHEIYERRPDQRLTMIYDRLTLYAWPKYYHRVFNDLMPYGIGDITHSSGNHDHFNQWMWQRLLWSPRLETEQVVNQYATYWFGHAAAPHMEKALFQLESNMEELKNEPLEVKKGIDTYYNLVKQAGAAMPSHLMKNNWLWRMYMQKGAIDTYAKHDVKQQIGIQKSIEQATKLPQTNAQLQAHIAKIEKTLKTVSPEMQRLKSEAVKLGEESNSIFGTRSDGLYSLAHDYIGLGWTKRQLQRAIESKSIEQRTDLLRMIYDYEGKSINAIYDNLGTANLAPNVTNGYPYDHGQPYVSTMLSEANRLSQRSMHFTQDEENGVTLVYEDLLPTKNYTLRLTLLRPTYQDRYLERMKQHKQSIYANGTLIASEVKIPEHMSDFITLEIPAHLIKNNKLEIKTMKDQAHIPSDRITTEQWRNTGGWGTILSEAWLIPTP